MINQYQCVHVSTAIKGVIFILCQTNNSTSVVLNALENVSAKQALAQSPLNSIQEFDGSDREATVPWLDQVELVAERTGIDH